MEVDIIEGRIAKEQEIKDQKSMANALARRREMIQRQLEKEREKKEYENRRLAEQLRTDEGLAQLAQAIEPQQMRQRKRKVRHSKKKLGGEEKQIDNQIREFKKDNRKQIRRLMKGIRG